LGNSPLEIGGCWVAKDKPMIISVGHLFSSKKASKERLAVEALLNKNCYGLTVTQRTSCWFLGKAFRMTGTMVGKLITLFNRLESQDEGTTSSSNELPESFLQKGFEECCISWFCCHKSTPVR